MSYSNCACKYKFWYKKGGTRKEKGLGYWKYFKEIEKYIFLDLDSDHANGLYESVSCLAMPSV